MMGLITVFGASGFIGRHVVRALALAGWRIRAVCRRPNLAMFLLPAGLPGQIELCRGNVLKPADVAGALTGAEAAVNLVGTHYCCGAQNFEALHIDAAGRIGEAAAKAGLKSLIHISAIGAAPLGLSRYAQTKGEGEARLREAFADAVILRPSVVFGAEDDFFNKFAWLATYLPALPLIGLGRNRLQPVYAGDVAAAVVHALTDDSARGKPFELGGPKPYTFRELMEFVLAVTKRRRLLVPLPVPAAKIAGFFLQMPSQILPMAPLLTVDQVRQLAEDNVVGTGALTLADLGVAATEMEDIVSAYLHRFRQPKF